MAKKATLSSVLDLTGENVLEIMLGKENITERYDAALATVQKEVEHILWEYLKGQNVKELVEKQQTIEELEALDIKLHPENFNETLANCIDTLDFPISGKVYLYGIWLQSFTNSSIRYFQDMLRIRAEIIERKKAGSRIILP